MRGILGSDHVIAVVLVRHAQRDPQVGIRAQVVLDDARRALRRHDEMDAERAAALSDIHDTVHELRNLIDERGELVDDDDKRRWRLGIAALLEFDEVLGFLASEEGLSVVEFCAQTHEGAADQVRAQIRDKPDAVRKAGALRESGPALVIDE